MVPIALQTSGITTIPAHMVNMVKFTVEVQERRYLPFIRISTLSNYTKKKFLKNVKFKFYLNIRV